MDSGIKKILFAVFALFVLVTVPAGADDVEPWDIWRSAYNDQVQAEQFLRQGKKAEAKLMFLRARDGYAALKSSRPDWNQELLDSRIAFCEAESQKLSDVEIARRVDVPRTPEEPEPSDEYKDRYFAVLVELDNMRKELEAARSSTMEISSLIAEKQALQEAYALLSNQYQELQNKSISPQSEVESMRSRLLETQLIADNAVRSRDILADSYEQLTADYDALVTARNDLRNENRSLRSRIADLEREINQSLANITAEKNRAETALGELQLKETEITELRRNIQRLSGDNAALLNNLTAEQNVDEALRSELQRYQERCETLEMDFLNMNAENRRLNAELRELRLEASGLGSSVQRLDAANRELTTQNTELTEQVQILSATADANGEEARTAAARAETLAAENTSLRAANETLEVRLKNNENNQLSLVAGYQQETGQLQEELAELRIALAAAESQVTNLTAALTEEQGKNNDLRNEYVDLKASQMSLSLELEEYKGLESRNLELETALAAAEAAQSELMTRVADLENQLAAVPPAPEIAATVNIPAPPEPAAVPAPAVSPVPEPAVPAEKAEEYLAAARQAVRDGFLELAVLEYKRLLRTAPEHLAGCAELGALYAADGRPADAVPYLQKVYDLNPEDNNNLKLYIETLAAAGRSQEVLALYGSLPENMKSDADILYAKGKALAAGNDWSGALSVYEQLGAGGSANPVLLVEYARILAALDKNDEAATAYNKARESGAAPDPAIESALGMKLDANRELCSFFETACEEAFAAGNWETVIWYTMKLIGMSPGNENYYFDWAYAAIALNRGNEAAAALAQASSRTQTLSPRSSQMRLLLAGTAELLMEKPAEAVKLFREAAVIGETADDGKGVFALENHYCGLPVMISKIIADLRKQPSVSRSDTEAAEAALAGLWQ